MSGPDAWSAAVVRGSDGVGASVVSVFTAVVPRSMRGVWFAVPVLDGSLEVTVPGVDAVARWRALEQVGLTVEPTDGSAVLDPSGYPDGEVWPGLPHVLAHATVRAVATLGDRGGFLPLDAAAVAASVEDVVAVGVGGAGDPVTVDVVLDAAADWLERVVRRRRGETDVEATGRPAADRVPVDPRVVALARAAHVHVTQLCGPSASADRLAAEAGVLRRLGGAASR